MGEKPLGIDETSVPTTTTGGVPDDLAPPDTSGAGSIITTRSNIKSAAGGMDADELADAGDATSMETGVAGSAVHDS
jgi:hypothetical protein